MNTLYNQNQSEQQKLEAHVLPLKLYFRIFSLLLAFFFMNIFIYLSVSQRFFYKVKQIDRILCHPTLQKISGILF